ncbi:WecB/TagA/CpsF family glycosyltransferase [Paenibacillus medicaginis]|uniref:WecB/TagA/CpsF family glycosyltransferase n=1 Tax=Paenibacillus medicaginis TaxID=1470560 RepID=A0ABV5BYC3_9BACL
MQRQMKYKYGKIINSNITALTFQETIIELEKWVANKENHYVCVCNTHSIVTASNDKLFATVLNNAGICTPDGTPVVWALRSYGFTEQDRVDGPNMMLKLCELSAQKKYKIFFYGGTAETLEQLNRKVTQMFEGIEIAGSYSPPFRNLTAYEETEIADMINTSNADFIFVSLGCPKQEIWMYNNREKIRGIMIGVGAAFEYITGNIKRPPLFFQKAGLEWVFRLISEPKRLWKRYAYNNPVYVYRFFKTYRKNKKISC